MNQTKIRMFKYLIVKEPQSQVFRLGKYEKIYESDNSMESQNAFRGK